MKVGVLPVGQVPPIVPAQIGEGLTKIFPDTSCHVIDTILPAAPESYDKKREQNNSSVILSSLRLYAARHSEFNQVLGVIDHDLYSTGLNYVFGEAYAPGKAALISLWRLRPEFYGEETGDILFKARTLKESVHEVGHTLGLPHCPRSLCVMHFSNSIFDTDRKQTFFCGQCYLQAALAISKLGQNI
jgi:archaemetzincin